MNNKRSKFYIIFDPYCYDVRESCTQPDGAIAEYDDIAEAVAECDRLNLERDEQRQDSWEECSLISWC